MSETDNDAVLKMIQEAEENGGLDTLVVKTITNQDHIRMVPDIILPFFETIQHYFEPFLIFHIKAGNGKHSLSRDTASIHFVICIF